MDKINKFIDSLKPLEKFALKTEVIKRFHMEPDYVIKHDEYGYYTESIYIQLNSLRFETYTMANLAYWIYISIINTGQPPIDAIKYVFRVLNLKSKWTK